MAVAMAMTLLLGRNYAQSFDSHRRTEAAHRRPRRPAARGKVGGRGGAPRGRDREPGQDPVLHCRQPRFAPAAARDGPLRRGAAARTHEPEVAQLVNSINESVDALEGLFSELLDITRIDSGGVDVHPDNFELAEIFRKIRLHFEPAAFEKGLELRIRGGRHVAFADPLLVERIVRNLVSNAIRYTQRRLGAGQRPPPGRPASGAGVGHGSGHSRGGPRPRLRGVLSGAGHAGGSVEQKKGLGLGLAIVKRLGALMAAPVTLHPSPAAAPSSPSSCRPAPGRARSSAPSPARRRSTSRSTAT